MVFVCIANNMKKKKLTIKIIFYITLAIIILSGAIFTASKLSYKQNPRTDNGKLQVITTLYPLYDFVKNIGQNKVDVTLLLPPGVEPHAFEPKPNDVIAINQTDVFIYTGKFMEVWVEDLLIGTTNNNLKVIDTSNGIKLILSQYSDKNKREDSSDPHIWLDFDNVQIMIDNIALGLIEKDPANKEFYLSNASYYKKRLIDLDQKYRKTLNKCKSKDVYYGGHYAFGYLTKRYGLNYVAAQGISPDSEPTVGGMISLVRQIKTKGIKYIFYEELTSPKISQTLADETGTGMLPLNAAHNITKQDLSSGLSYLSIMEDNLAKLRTGLECI